PTQPARRRRSPRGAGAARRPRAAPGAAGRRVGSAPRPRPRGRRDRAVWSARRGTSAGGRRTPRAPGTRARARVGAPPRDARLLPEARGVVVRRSARLELRVFGVELDCALDEHVLGLRAARIRQAALDRADRLTRLVIVEAHALG